MSNKSGLVRSPSAAVEALCDEVSRLSTEAERVELWVPGSLTLQGALVPHDLAMAVLLDAILARGFFPAGKTDEPGGAVYRYTRSEI